MHVNIVCEDMEWILGKFARRLQENLEKMNIKATISERRNPSADINHHVMFDFLNFVKHPNDTFMIAHVDQYWHVDLLKDRLKKSGMGICMSEETMNKLVSYGLPRNKLCYINPAQDGVIKPRKIVVGITHRCYSKTDFRKRERFLLDILKCVETDFFRFEIMGSGWDDIVSEMQENGVEVNYYPEFDYNRYTELMPTLDYYLYFGTDEGNMGYLDALAAGVKTIVTPQGFHLDARNGITYPCDTLDDYVDTFNKICQEKKELMNAVKDWTWENFTKKHLEVWGYIQGTIPYDELYRNRGIYKDGIFSVMPNDYSIHSFLVKEIQDKDVRKISKRVVRKTKEVFQEKMGHHQ